MTSRFPFHIRRCIVSLVGILIVVVLASCQSGAPVQLLPTLTAPPTLDFDTITPGPTPTATGSPTPRPTLRPSSTLIPTATRLPSFTPVPTATMTLPPTPFPALSAARPYMVYYSAPGDKPSIVVLNTDASGRSVFPMPVGSQPPRLPQALSSNGQWLAFYTGTAGDPQKGPAAAGQFDLTLNLMHLPDGKIKTVAPLLAKDYPDSLRKLAAQIVEKDSSKAQNAADLYTQVWNDFYSGITQAAWSPDGRILAFTGEMNSPSSNIYFYNPATGTITQATNGSEQIEWLLWSPDGRYILYSSSNQQCSGDCASRYALEVASGKSTPLANMVTHNGGLVLFDWVGPHTITYATYTNGEGASYLAEIDLTTGATTDLFANAFNDYALDSGDGLVALTLTRDVVTQKNMQPGLYLYHTNGGKLDFVASSGATPDFSLVYWGQPQYPFLVWDKDKVYGLTGDSKLEVIAESNLQTVASNGQWIVVKDAKANPPALKIIDAKKQVVNTVSVKFAGRMFSNPDSTGFFSIYENGLYYLDIKTGVWKQVDSDLPEPPDWSRRPLLFGWKS